MPDISPLYFTVNTDGSVNAVFPGGLTIPEALFGDGPVPGKAIRWQRDNDGEIHSYIYARNTGGSGVSQGDPLLQIVSTDDAEGARVQLQAVLDGPSLGDALSWLTLYTQRTPRLASIDATLWNPILDKLYDPVVIYDAQGRSSFVQLNQDVAGTGQFGPAARETHLVPLAWAVPGLAAGGGAILANISTGLPFAGANVYCAFGDIGTGQLGMAAYATANVGGVLNINAGVHNASGAACGASTLIGLAFVMY